MDEQKPIPEMITIRETAKRSGIRYEAIRQMCKTGKITYIMVGAKYLINWDRFIDYLNTGDQTNCTTRC